MTSSGASRSDDWDRTRSPRIWGGVPLRNPSFTGREELLEQLRLRLAEPTTLPEVLHGMGGIGKSQIAIEYIYRHLHEYDLVWWIPAENATQIRAGFVTLAQRLDISADDEDSVIAALLRELGNGSRGLRWILVFDNAGSPEVVRPFLPTGGHVVVTSRNAEWAQFGRMTEIGPVPATNTHPDGTYVICVFDLEKYGSDDHTRQTRMAIRQGMHTVVEAAFARAGIPWHGSYRRDTGDGILIAVPAADADKGAFVGELLTVLTELLDEHNETHPGEVIRLRLAMDVSEVAFDRVGPDGHGFIHVERLVEAPPLKAVLARSAKPLAVITSAYVHNEIVKQHGRYAPEEYRKVAVQVKETDAFGWIRVPGGQLPPVPEVPVFRRAGRYLLASVRGVVEGVSRKF